MIEIWLINIGCVVTFLATAARHWLVAKGNLFWVYWLMLVTAVSNGTLNIVIVKENPAYWGIWSFNLVIAWSVVMAIKGLLRLREEKRW